MSRDRIPTTADDKPAADRASRRGAALRANLARRKAQARSRAEADVQTGADTPTNDREGGTSSPDTPASED